MGRARQLLELAGELGELSARAAEQRRHFLERLCRIVDAQVGILCCEIHDFTSGGAGRSVEGIDVGWNTESERAHVLQMLAGEGLAPDPLGAAMMRGYRGAAFACRRVDLVADAEWYGSRYFCDYRRAGHVDDAIYSIRPLAAPGRVEGVGMSRPTGARPFTEEERAVVDLAHEAFFRVARRRRAALPPGGAALSAREREVLAQLLTGRSEKQVAAALGLSRHTVHQYVTSIYRSFGVSSRAELMSRCLGGGREAGERS